MNHKSNRMLNDLKEIEKHLLNVASIEEGESTWKAYRDAATKIGSLSKTYSVKATMNNLKGIVKVLNRMNLDEKSVKAYRYAAHLVEDLITDYGTA